jgi:hypothetical protein
LNPNSANQIWTEWRWTVHPGRRVRRPFEEVKTNLARFAALAFGSVTRLRIGEFTNGYRIEITTEGAPLHDPDYRDYMDRNWKKFLILGFGEGTNVQLETKLLAGSRQDGKAPDQWIEIPTIRMEGPYGR